MNVVLIILGLTVIVLAIMLPIWWGRRAWRGEFEDQVDEIDERAAMRDYHL